MSETTSQDAALRRLDQLIASTVEVVSTMERHLAALLSLGRDASSAFDALDAGYHALGLYRVRRRRLVDELRLVDRAPGEHPLEEPSRFALTTDQLALLRRVRDGTAAPAGTHDRRTADALAQLACFGLVQRHRGDFSLTPWGWACLHRREAE